MADEASESLFKPLYHPLFGKHPSLFAFFACFIALLMSFFIMKEVSLKSLGALKKNERLTAQSNTLIYRPLNRLVTANLTIHPALLSLCKLTHLAVDNNTNLENIIHETQKHWLRNPDTERHELTQGNYDAYKDQMLPLLKELNVTSTVRAKHTDKPYDIALIHGATSDAVITRIQFLISEYQRGVRFKKVVLLTGDRPLDPIKERKYIKLGLKTESEMFLYLWKKTPGLPNTLKKDFDLINTKGKRLNRRYKRPTTRDTIDAWLHEDSFLPNSRCLAISNQPFVPFQDFVFYNTLKEKFGHLYLETIGESADSSELIALHLDNLARCLYELQLPKLLKSSHNS